MRFLVNEFWTEPSITNQPAAVRLALMYLALKTSNCRKPVKLEWFQKLFPNGTVDAIAKVIDQLKEGGFLVDQDGELVLRLPMVTRNTDEHIPVIRLWYEVIGNLPWIPTIDRLPTVHWEAARRFVLFCKTRHLNYMVLARDIFTEVGKLEWLWQKAPNGVAVYNPTPAWALTPAVFTVLLSGKLTHEEALKRNLIPTDAMVLKAWFDRLERKGVKKHLTRAENSLLAE